MDIFDWRRLQVFFTDASKVEVAKLPDPTKKSRAVRMDSRSPDEWYADADPCFFAELCRCNLKHTCGYRYWLSRTPKPAIPVASLV